jgi:hypothetical protein
MGIISINIVHRTEFTHDNWYSLLYLRTLLRCEPLIEFYCSAEMIVIKTISIRRGKISSLDLFFVYPRKSSLILSKISQQFRYTHQSKS